MNRPAPRLLRILPFIGIISLFLYIANLVVYEALADIFIITASWQLVTLGTALGILSGSFIVVTILGSWYYNLFTRSFYTLTAIWMGLLVYLFLAAVAYGLLVMLSGMLLSSVGELLVAGALVASGYGVLHARDIRVAEVAVSLPRLPASWQGRKAIWISDLHLGQLHGASFARNVVERINAIPHDIIFIGGDLYDGTGAPDINELTAPLKALAAPLGTYFITGNHEEFGDASAFITAVRSAGIRPLIDEMVEIDGLQLIGIDYHNGSNRENLKKILSGLSIRQDAPSILLKHEPKDLDIAREARVSLQISGHTHKAQLWPLGYIAQLVYKGFAYGLKQSGEMQVYTSSGTGTWGPPLRVGTNGEIVVLTFS
jgi:predicted MPP superfamily phosphohydrolase